LNRSTREAAMSSEQNDGLIDIKVGADLQFNTLREEMIMRIELRHQIMVMTLAVAGIVLGFGVNVGSIASAGGIFLITQALAIGVGILNFRYSLAGWFLLFIDILSIKPAYSK
jgi:hypothetical protein